MFQYQPETKKYLDKTFDYAARMFPVGLKFAVPCPSERRHISLVITAHIKGPSDQLTLEAVEI